MKNKIFISIVFCTLILPLAFFAEDQVPADAEDAEIGPRIMPETALKAISMLEEDPNSEKIHGILGFISNFAEKSDDVLVVVDQKYFPWMIGINGTNENIQNLKKTSSLLIGAFIAGNVKPQIQKKEKKDHPFEGLKLMLKLYKIWSEKGTIEKIQQLDDWTKLDDSQLHKLCETNAAK
jgi:hypothetical protein